MCVSMWVLQIPCVDVCVFQITAAEYASIGVSSLRLQLSDCGSMVAARLGMKVMKAKVMKAAKAKVKKAATANKSRKTPSKDVKDVEKIPPVLLYSNDDQLGSVLSDWNTYLPTRFIYLLWYPFPLDSNSIFCINLVSSHQCIL